jgi:hypothetical protein
MKTACLQSNIVALTFADRLMALVIFRDRRHLSNTSNDKRDLMKNHRLYKPGFTLAVIRRLALHGSVRVPKDRSNFSNSLDQVSLLLL